MSKKTNKQDKIFKSSFFWKLFSIPSICISLMAIYGMFLPDEPGEEPTTWIDFFEGMIIILILWFTISFVIALIFNEVKNNQKG